MSIQPQRWIEFNNMESHDDPIPKKNNGKLIKKCTNESVKSDPSEIGRTYGIDIIIWGEGAHDSDNNSAWILAQLSIGQTENDTNKDNSITH